jgi:hypothetical protein
MQVGILPENVFKIYDMLESSGSVIISSTSNKSFFTVDFVNPIFTQTKGITRLTYNLQLPSFKGQLLWLTKRKKLFLQFFF